MSLFLHSTPFLYPDEPGHVLPPDYFDGLYQRTLTPLLLTLRDYETLKHPVLAATAADKLWDPLTKAHAANQSWNLEQMTRWKERVKVASDIEWDELVTRLVDEECLRCYQEIARARDADETESEGTNEQRRKGYIKFD